MTQDALPHVLRARVFMHAVWLRAGSKRGAPARPYLMCCSLSRCAQRWHATAARMGAGSPQSLLGGAVRVLDTSSRVPMPVVCVKLMVAV
jgi:hypothetical protein